MKKLSVFIIPGLLVLMAACNQNPSEDATEKVKTEQSDLTDEQTDSEGETESVVDEVPASEDPSPGDRSETNTRSEKQVEPAPKSESPSKVKKSALSFLKDDVGLDVGQDIPLNLTTYAAEDVAIIREGNCGENCGKKVLATNYHREKTIEVVVHLKWKVEKEKNSKMRVYQLGPEEKVQIGCSMDCSGRATGIKWAIVSAEYVD